MAADPLIDAATARFVGKPLHINAAIKNARPGTEIILLSLITTPLVFNFDVRIIQFE
jgi:hypothetical protein